MDVVVYGVEEVPSGFRVVRSVEELRRHVGKAFLVVVGDKRLAEELGVAYFSEEEWGFLAICGSPPPLSVSIYTRLTGSSSASSGCIERLLRRIERRVFCKEKKVQERDVVIVPTRRRKRKCNLQCYKRRYGHYPPPRYS